MQTRVYKYGLLPPTTNAELVSQQMISAHRYYNDLISIERSRREAVRAILSAHSTVEPLELEAARIALELEAARAEARASRQETGSKLAAAPLRAKVRALADTIKAARAELRTAKKALHDDVIIGTAIEQANEAAKSAAKHARASCGCYWGTYLIIEQAIDAARKSKMDPRFKRWTGDAAVGVQIQGGVIWGDVLACEDTRIQIDTTPAPCGKGKPRPILRVRVGSDVRSPIWAEWPIILHRDVPIGGTLKAARVSKRLLAGKPKWTVELTLSLPAEHRTEDHGRGAVAVDIGWRRTGENLRVAYIEDDQRSGAELLLPGGVESRMKKVEDLRSIRDQNLDVLRPLLAASLRANTIPEWLREATSSLHQWKSPARFAALAWKWKTARFDGDSEMLDLLESWRKQDKHLWTWEANQRQRTLARRKNEYRVIGAKLARRYQTLVIEQFNLSEMQRSPDEGSEKTEVTQAKYQQRLAACFELRIALVQAFAARGGVVVEIPAAYTSRTCHECGAILEIGSAVDHVCPRCLTAWDRDANACRNLLQRYRLLCERPDGTENTGGARIKDYGEIAGPRESKWGKLKREKEAARNAECNVAV